MDEGKCISNAKTTIPAGALLRENMQTCTNETSPLILKPP